MKWVLALSVGPVSGFIAAGRRSRDLWYGSTWLSETTFQVAEELLRQATNGVGVSLLLPTEKRLRDLRAQYARDKELHGGRLSNKVLAEVTLPDAGDAQAKLRSIAEACRACANEFLCEEIDQLRGVAPLAKLLDLGAVDAQKQAIRAGDFVEFSAAWVPFTSDDPVAEGKAGGQGRVERACMLRDATPKFFSHPASTRRGFDRSDLDEGRDTVLLARDDSFGARRGRALAGMIENEQLDVIGLVRRMRPYLHRRSGNVRHQRLPFPPLARVTADPWIARVTQRKDLEVPLKRLGDALAEAADTPSADFDLWCSECSEPQEVKGFPYDASLLFEDGCDSARRIVRRVYEHADDEGQTQSASIDQRIAEITGYVRALHKGADVPIPYYALLAVDGDRVGDLLKRQPDKGRYGALVAALDEFASRASDAVETCGAAFFVAGDELRAYVPLDRALPLAVSLSTHYKTALKDWPAEDLSLSAGIVFAHVKDDLRAVRKAASDALDDAKRLGRGWACIREMPRAGSDREVSGPMDALRTEMDALAAGVRRGVISLRTEQHLREHHERFREVDGVPDAAPPGVLLARDAVRRQFERAGRDEADNKTLGGYVDALKNWDDVLRLADAIRVASRIADVGAQRGTP